ncbi:hypothetical protein Trydic_g6117 [Trypoxylus dichotomus]
MVRNSERNKGETNNEVRLPKNQHGSITKIGNNSMKIAPNSGNANVRTRSRKQNHSKVPLRRLNSEAILKKIEKENKISSKSWFDVNQVSSAALDRFNKFAVQQDGNMELELLKSSHAPYQLEDIFFKEINAPTKHSENSHLLVDVIEELRDIEETLSKPRVSSKRKASRKSPKRSQTANNPKTESAMKDRKNFNRERDKRKPMTFCSFICEEYAVIRPYTVPDKKTSNFFSKSEFLSKIPIRSYKEATTRCIKMVSADQLPNHRPISKSQQRIESRERYAGMHQKTIDRKYFFEGISDLQENKNARDSGKPLVGIKFHKQEKRIAEETGSSVSSNVLENKVSKTPRTVSSLNMESQIKDRYKMNLGQQKIVSKIPVGVKSNGCISSNLIINEKLGTEQKEITKEPKNLPGDNGEYQLMAVPKAMHSQVAKFINESVNLSQEYPETKSQTQLYKRDAENVKIETVEETGADLEVKKGYENILQPNSQFCYGVKSNNRPRLSSSASHKPPKKTETKTKSKRFFNIKSRSWLNSTKVNLKPTVSSPDTRAKTTLASLSSAKPKFEKKPIETETDVKKVFQKKSPIENVPNRMFKDDLDYELLEKLENKSKPKTAVTTKHEIVFAIEKYTQTFVDTNNTEVQVNAIWDLDTLDKKPGFASIASNISNRDIKEHEESVVIANTKQTDNFTSILDCCRELLKCKQSLEEVLLKYKDIRNTSGIEIGCQPEFFASIDSFSQTSYSIMDKSCQSSEERCTISLNLNTLHQTDISKSNNGFSACTSNAKVKRVQSLNDTLNLYKTADLQNIPSICLTIDKCTAPGLDRNTYKRKMSCYCKENFDKDKIEVERPKNLFEDEYSDEEYSECYMKELTDGIVLKDETKACGSTLSLPEVVVASDRCESKMEIPWLKISLAPPGYYEIKNMPGYPKQVMCDCWALSNGDDVYVQPIQPVYDELECQCDNAQTYAIKAIPPSKPVHPSNIPQLRTQTAPTGTNMSPPVRRSPQTAPARSTTPPPANPEISDNTSAPFEPQTDIEEQPPPPLQEVEDVNPGNEPEEAEIPPSSEEPFTPPPTPVEDESAITGTHDGGDVVESEVEGGGGGGTSQQPPPSTIDETNSSSSSIPSTCICLRPMDDCDGIIGRPTDFVFENTCYAQHETYMDPIYKLFPDDCDTYCGPYIEMPWSDLTIPRNIRLRQAKKVDVRPSSKHCKCDKKHDSDANKSDGRDTDNEIVVCGTKDERNAMSERKQSDAPAEIVGNMAKAINRSIKSAQSSRSRSRNRALSSEPFQFGCRCSSDRSSRSTSPSKFKTTASKSTNSKSSVRIDPTTPISSQRPPSPDEFHRYKRNRCPDPVMSALETCEAEMEPLRDSLNQLKSKIRNLNIPELSNWNGATSAHCAGCPPQCAMPIMPSSSVNYPQSFPGLRPPPPHLPFPPMFRGLPPMNPPMNPPHMFLPPQRCCPCVCRKQRIRRGSDKSVSSGSTEYSEYDSLSEGESLCPFLRALSNKALYKEKEPKSQRKCKTRESQTKRRPTTASKRYNKRSQADYARQDNYTDTEPEIQVHYGPKRRRMKTKQVFKSIIDPNMIATKNQRLRIAVKVTPSDVILSEDNLLAIQGPGQFSKYSDSGRKKSH